MEIYNNNNNNSCIYNAHISIQRGCSRRNILLLPRSLDTISRPHLSYSAQFPLPREHSLPSCLSWRSDKYIHNIIIHILLGTHLYTWVESSNVDKVSCWRTTVPGIDGNRTRNPLIQSQGFTPIYHGTSTHHLEEWFIITLCMFLILAYYIQQLLIVDHISLEAGLKVIDYIVQSAKYWCPNGTNFQFLQTYSPEASKHKNPAYIRTNQANFNFYCSTRAYISLKPI